MFKQLAWSIIKPLIVPWLRTRALVLPAGKSVEIARKFSVPVEVVNGVNQALIEQALSQLDAFRP